MLYRVTNINLKNKSSKRFKRHVSVAGKSLNLGSSTVVTEEELAEVMAMVAMPGVKWNRFHQLAAEPIEDAEIVVDVPDTAEVVAEVIVEPVSETEDIDIPQVDEDAAEAVVADEPISNMPPTINLNDVPDIATDETDEVVDEDGEEMESFGMTQGEMLDLLDPAHEEDVVAPVETVEEVVPATEEPKKPKRSRKK